MASRDSTSDSTRDSESLAELLRNPAAIENRRRQERRVMWVMALGSLLIGGGILAGFLYLSHGAGAAIAVSPKDRRMLVSAVDLQPIRGGLVVRPDSERISKKSYADGRLVLDYWHRQQDGPNSLSIHCRVVLLPDAATAANLYDEMFGELRQRSTSRGFEMTDWPAPTWGASHVGTFRDAQSYQGNYFIGQQAERVYLLEITDFCLEDPDELAGLLLPALTAAEQFQPVN